MRFSGVLPEDAPDPRLEQTERLRAMPVPIVELVAQPSLEETYAALNSGSDGEGHFELAATLSYLLWRNPADRADPVNLAELDERTRASLDEVPPWPRPQWILDAVDRMRYPSLWEAVTTWWHRAASEQSTPTALLIRHAAHVLDNVYRPERGLESAWTPPPTGRITDAMLRRGVPVMVDGVEVDGVEFDADPFVYGLAAVLPSGGVLTAVLPRAELAHIRIAFATRR